MKIKAVFGPDGRPTAFYNTDVWDEGKMPAEAVEISQQDWQTMIQNQGRCTYVGGKVVLAPVANVAVNLSVK